MASWSAQKYHPLQATQLQSPAADRWGSKRLPIANAHRPFLALGFPIFLRTRQHRLWLGVCAKSGESQRQTIPISSASPSTHPTQTQAPFPPLPSPPPGGATHILQGPLGALLSTFVRTRHFLATRMMNVCSTIHYGNKDYAV